MFIALREEHSIQCYVWRSFRVCVAFHSVFYCMFSVGFETINASSAEQEALDLGMVRPPLQELELKLEFKVLLGSQPPEVHHSEGRFLIYRSQSMRTMRDRDGVHDSHSYPSAFIIRR